MWLIFQLKSDSNVISQKPSDPGNPTSLTFSIIFKYDLRPTFSFTKNKLIVQMDGIWSLILILKATLQHHLYLGFSYIPGTKMLKRVTRALTRLRGKDHWWCHAHVHMDLISKSSFLGRYGGPGYACYFLRRVKSLFLFFIFIVTPGWIPFA